MLEPEIFGTYPFYVLQLHSLFCGIHFETSWSKSSLLNRYFIGGPNGTQTLIIPLKNLSSKKWQDLAIDYSHKWIKEHIHSLKTAYGKSPYYDYYDYKLIPIFETKYHWLKDLFYASDEFISRALNLEPLNIIETTIKNSSSIIINPEFNEINTTPYFQNFDNKFGFRSGLSVLDIIFHLGPNAGTHLVRDSV